MSDRVPTETTTGGSVLPDDAAALFGAAPTTLGAKPHTRTIFPEEWFSNEAVVRAAGRLAGRYDRHKQTVELTPSEMEQVRTARRFLKQYQRRRRRERDKDATDSGASTAPIKPQMQVYLAVPHGLCPGVERTYKIVDDALKTFGQPVYFLHEIIHNRFAIEALEKKGVIFVEELDEVPDNACVILGTHGTPKSTLAEAARRNLNYINSVCPIVSNIHRFIEDRALHGNKILLVGQFGHPEVIGTLGQAPLGAIELVQHIGDAETIEPNARKLTLVRQTTLSESDTSEVTSILRQRFQTLKRFLRMTSALPPRTVNAPPNH